MLSKKVHMYLSSNYLSLPLSHLFLSFTPALVLYSLCIPPSKIYPSETNPSMADWFSVPLYQHLIALIISNLTVY